MAKSNHCIFPTSKIVKDEIYDFLICFLCLKIQFLNNKVTSDIHVNQIQKCDKIKVATITQYVQVVAKTFLIQLMFVVIITTSIGT